MREGDKICLPGHVSGLEEKSNFAGEVKVGQGSGRADLPNVKAWAMTNIGCCVRLLSRASLVDSSHVA